MLEKSDRRFRFLALLAAVLLSFGLVACGDDGDDAASTDTTEAAAPEAEDFTAYCDATIDIETLPDPDIDFDSLSPEEQKAAAKKFATEELVDRAAAIEAVAPEEIAADIATLVAGVDTVAETGDFGVFEKPEVEAASDRAHAFDVENCGWGKSDVAASEYKFEGLEASYQAGPISFEFTNAGKELHELILLKKKADTTESFDELLELPEEESKSKVDEEGAIFAMPGDGDYFVTDLTAGEYIALCFIPVGLTPEASEAAEKGGEEPKGPPHFTQGMKVTFTVT